MTAFPRLALPLFLVIAATASAQSLSQRITDHRERQARKEKAAAQDEAAQLRRLSSRVAGTIARVEMEDLEAKSAIKWWSNTTQVPIVLNWEMMRNEGIEGDALVNLKLHNVPAGTVLSIILQQMAPSDATIITELSPWYMRIMPRNEALRYTVTRVYDIGDLLFEVPNFTNAPSMDLSDALSSGGTGGSGNSGGASSTSIFGGSSDSDEDDNDSPSKEDRAFQLAQLVRDSIEPDIWIAHGGLHSSIRYFQSRLVVRAPMFVQRQIGASVGSPAGITALAVQRAKIAARKGEKPSNVSGVAKGDAQRVSKPQKKK